MRIKDCNPYVRMAQIQPAVIEGKEYRFPYDHRIFYVLEGTGTLLLRDEEYAIGRDTILCFMPEEGYYFKGKMKMVVINFDVTRNEAHRTVALCPAVKNEFSSLNKFDSTVLEEINAPIVQKDCCYLRDTVIAIATSFRLNDEYADAITSSLLKKLLADLINLSAGVIKNEKELAKKVERYIELYAADICNNKQIGAAFGYHPVYIATIFKESKGMSLYQAIINRKIELACQWLTQTELSVENIAFDLGFSTRSHFCTVFKKRMGITPRNFREKNKGSV